MSRRQTISNIKEVRDDQYYRVADLSAVLKNKGLSYSIFTIRDAETWKCMNWKCWYRNIKPVNKCIRCGSDVKSPLIISPRSSGGGKGVGHRLYTGKELKAIVQTFEKRVSS